MQRQTELDLPTIYGSKASGTSDLLRIFPNQLLSRRESQETETSVLDWPVFHATVFDPEVTEESWKLWYTSYRPTPDLMSDRLDRLVDKMDQLTENIERIADALEQVVAVVKEGGALATSPESETGARMAQSVEALAEAYDREGLSLSQNELEALYDDDFFEALELAEKHS
jgi:hypothetical protein